MSAHKDMAAIFGGALERISAPAAERPERFKVGDYVWTCYAGSIQQTRPCRACAGTKAVTLILGSGEHVRLDCEACSRGYEAPTGTEQEYAYGVTASSYRVTGVEVVQTEKGEEVKYRSGSDGCYTSLNHERCFATEAEALASGVSLVAEAEAEAEKRIAWKVQDKNKSYAWNASYHLRRAKDAAKDLDYHTRKAAVLKLKAKEES